jgi:ATP-dependent RNA helicase DDX56/DBP9
MKRKLDQMAEPSSEVVAETPVNSATPAAETQEEATFADLGLDPRLVQAVAKQKFEKPTLVQRKAIPLALNGQDVLAKAKTGSGKTAAYVLPLLSSILRRKSVGSPISALLPVPMAQLTSC